MPQDKELLEIDAIVDSPQIRPRRKACKAAFAGGGRSVPLLNRPFGEDYFTSIRSIPTM